MGNYTSLILDIVKRTSARHRQKDVLASKDSKDTFGLFITGLGGQYPSGVLKPDDLEHIVNSICASQVESPGIRKLLAINQASGISERRSVCPVSNLSNAHLDPPPIDELSRLFRTIGVDLTISACEKALREAGLSPADITHTVGVTCTDAGNPGYDHLVSQRLKLRPDVDRVLLHGVGCAGGLSALRVAASLAAGATQRRRPARILVFACELCSIHMRCDLYHACENPADVSIGSALFSDAAAALVLCNNIGLGIKTKPVFELLEWDNMILPGTTQYMSFVTDPRGFRCTLAKEVPQKIVQAVRPMFERVRPSLTSKITGSVYGTLEASDCDWALHPGGIAILKGAQKVLNLNEDQLRASMEVYKTRGNSSSPTVLLVLDKLRHMGNGRDKVVAMSFGPGLAIEAATMRRCR